MHAAATPQHNDLPGGTTADRWVGSEIAGYRLVQVVGQGGMAKVYEAEHCRLGRRVALKMLRSSLANDAVARSRFFDEARAVNQIQHPNIIEVNDFLEQPDTPACYVMEFLEGEDLSDFVEREGRLDLESLLPIAIQIASALTAVHSAGIVHRDLKPQNVFLAPRSGAPHFVKLLDFGVCKSTSDTNPDSFSATESGALIGTPDYMAPEQIDDGKVTRQTDVYAFGAMLYKLATGSTPFVANSVTELAVKILTQDPARISERYPAAGVPAELEALILSCLSKLPSQRPASMKVVEEKLLRLAGRPVASRAIFRRRAVAALSLALAAGGAAAWTLSIQAPSSERPIAALVAGPLPLPSPTSAPGETAPVAGTPGGADNRQAEEPTPTVITSTVGIRSAPPGAEVLDDEGVVLGTTPMTLVFPEGSGPQEVWFRLPGHDTVTERFRPGSDDEVVATLKERQIPAARVRKAPRSRTDSRRVAKGARDQNRRATARREPVDVKETESAPLPTDTAQPGSDSEERAGAQKTDTPTADTAAQQADDKQATSQSDKESIGGGDLIDPFAG